MANTTVVTVTVEELSKYGFKANGRYVGLSKQLSETDKAMIVPGATFEAEFYVADSGKEYLNKIIASKAVAKAEPKADVERAKRFTPKYAKKADSTSAGLTKDEWQAKDTRISRQGVIQAAVQAIAPLVSLENVFEESEKLANQMLDFVNQK
jgi:hypothetical protein